MTIQQAIEKANEGGWNWKEDFEYPADLDVSPGYAVALATASKEKVLLSPRFWQGLGKSLGWNRRMMLQVYTKDDGERSNTVDGAAEWIYQMHRLVGHLAEGKSIESYFETL